MNFLSAHFWSASASGNPVTFHVAKNNPGASLWSDQLSPGIRRKWMSVLAMVP